MTENIRLVVDLKIKKGKADTVRTIAKELVTIASKEKGTLAYHSFIDKAGTRAMFVERYADNDAVLGHLSNVDAVLPKLLAVADIESLRLLGPTNDEVQKAMKPMGAVFLENLANAKKIVQTH